MAERDAVAVNGDAIRGGLAGDGDVARENELRRDIDHAAHVEHDGAVALADCVAERAGAGVVEVGDVIDRPAAAAGGQAPKAFGRWEGPQLGEARRWKCGYRE